MGRVARLSYATALCLAAGCAVETDADVSGHAQGIIEGDPAADSDWVSVGMLLARGNISEGGAEAVNRIMGLCTATLISPTAVLTAEHCVNQMILKQSLGQDPRGLTIEGDVTFQFTFARKITEVQAGTATLLEVESVDSSETFAPIANPIAAFQPAPAKWDDIAIVHLAEPVTGRRLQPLATPAIVEALTIDEASMYRAAGYGLTNDDDPMSAGTLTAGLSHLDEIGDNEITAGNMDRQQACRGDSGGPLFSDDTDGFQIGIASRVNKPLTIDDIVNGQNGEPPPCETGLAYTRVDAYLDWIAERVPDLPPPGTAVPPGSGDGDGDGDGDTGDGSSDGDTGDDGEGDGSVGGDGDGEPGNAGGGKRDGGCSVAQGPENLGALAAFGAFVMSITVRRRRRAS